MIFPGGLSEFVEPRWMTALWKPPTKTVEPTGDQQHAVNRQIGVNVMLFRFRIAI